MCYVIMLSLCLAWLLPSAHRVAVTAFGSPSYLLVPNLYLVNLSDLEEKFR